MSQNINQKAEEYASQFKIEGKVSLVEAFGTGHINDTYCVKTNNNSNIQYLLQRINHHVFKNVKGLMSNIDIVLKHLKDKYKVIDPDNADLRTLTLIPTIDGEKYFVDESGSYWRMFILIQNTKSYDIVETTDQAFAGGKAFGEFQTLLADLDSTRLVEVLPDFHNIEFRMSNLRKAIECNYEGRAEKVSELLKFIFDREELMKTVLNMGGKGLLPLRITHNDTKFNNVLLDSKDNVQCVIDLDTVMPGYVAYDFGDAIRTIINSAAEDEADLDKIVLNIPLYEAYAEGYLSEAKSFLTEEEMESLIYGVFLLPYMQGVRFLTDYLEGDHYYKIQYPEHNLVRTKAQLKLVKELEDNRSKLEDILRINIESKI